MKNNYLSPIASVVYFEQEDIITTSKTFGPDDKDVTGNDIYNGFGD